MKPVLPITLKLVSITAAAVFVVDRLSKWFVVEFLDLYSRRAIDVLPPFLNFRMAWNEGINFGLFSNSADVMRYFLICLALVIVVGLGVWVRNQKGKLIPISVGVVIGGALGNVVDRMIYGAVADFLNMSCCGIRNPFSFNVADIAIFAGVLVLIVFGDPQQSARKKGK